MPCELDHIIVWTGVGAPGAQTTHDSGPSAEFCEWSVFLWLYCKSSAFSACFLSQYSLVVFRTSQWTNSWRRVSLSMEPVSSKTLTHGIANSLNTASTS